jgi:LytS/YehU family sensor histidine kinase
VTRIEVENSGQLGPAQSTDAQTTSDGDGMGLANARERLRILYGDRASLQLRNGDGRVVATVLIPSDAQGGSHASA